MLPGKKYSPEELLQIALKRIWFVLVPFALVSAVTAVIVRQMPNRYRSEAAIQIEPQRVPEAYVKATVTGSVEARLQSIQQTVLSRTKLERIITEFNLYEKERKEGIMEDVVQRMRNRDILLDPLRGDAFRVSFQGTDPRVVTRVAEKLASLFIDEDLQDRSQKAENTNQFLEAQLEEAKQRLIEQEKKVEDYKLRHAGQLPSQLESNLQVLQSAQAQLQDVIQGLHRERDHETRLERDIEDLEQQIADIPTPVTGVPGDETPERQLAVARERLAATLTTKRDTHPDVKRLRVEVADLEAKVAGTKPLDAPVSEDLRRLSPADAARRRRLDDMKLELSTVKRNISEGEREQQRLKRDIGLYQSRNEAIPTRETEMTELLRDYSTLNSVYLNLLAKREDSKIAANMETRQIGEQFRILDQPRIPERPFSPDRMRYNLMGMAAGIAIGLALIVLLEYRDRSFKTDTEVTQLLSLPVLAVVPVMASKQEKQRAFRLRLVKGVGLGTTVLACLAVAIYTWVR